MAKAGVNHPIFCLKKTKLVMDSLTICIITNWIILVETKQEIKSFFFYKIAPLEENPIQFLFS